MNFVLHGYAVSGGITVGYAHLVSTARLEVADRGIGIPVERLPHVFGRFERAVSSRHYGGLGLGLYIVHEIVTALHGKVSVESAEGQGARFTVELPLHWPDR